MRDEVSAAYEQAFAQSHEMGLKQSDRENQGMGNIAEQTRLLFLTRSQANDLAQDILDQRSAQQQPQIGVLPTK